MQRQESTTRPPLDARRRGHDDAARLMTSHERESMGAGVYHPQRPRFIRAIPACARLSQIISWLGGASRNPQCANGFQGQGHGWRHPLFSFPVPADSQAGSEFVDAPAFGLQAIPETGGWMGWDSSCHSYTSPQGLCPRLPGSRSAANCQTPERSRFLDDYRSTGATADLVSPSPPDVRRRLGHPATGQCGPRGLDSSGWRRPAPRISAPACLNFTPALYHVPGQCARRT